MEDRDSIKALDEQEMDGVLGGAAGLGGWGAKDYSKTLSSVKLDSAAGLSEGLLDDAAQSLSKGADPTV